MATTTKEAKVSTETFETSLETLERIAEGGTQGPFCQWENGKIVKMNMVFEDGETVDMLDLIYNYVIWTRTPTNIPPLGYQPSLKVFSNFIEFILEVFESYLRNFDRDILKEFTRPFRLPRIQDYLDDLPTVVNDLVGCSICLDDPSAPNNLVSLRCHTSHQFHRNCIQVWLTERDDCPICRSDVLKYDATGT